MSAYVVAPNGIIFECPPDEDSEQQEQLLKTLLSTVSHFFGGFTRLFHPVTDPRHPLYIT